MTRQSPTKAPRHVILTALLIELWRYIRSRPEPEPDPETLSVLFGFEQGPLETYYQQFHLPPEAEQSAVTARFARFAEAYLALRDSEKRAAYDLELAKKAHGHRHLLTRGDLDRTGPAYRSSASSRPTSGQRLGEAPGVPRGFRQPHWETYYQVLRLHPTAGREAAEARFAQLLEAYLALSNPTHRQAYNLELQMKALRHEVAELKRSDPDRFDPLDVQPGEA